MLETMNHPNVRVLDGGFAKWVSENKPCESTDKDAKE
jgi:3-mercaptopyruvate sulfurtransferase SseA